MNKGYNRYLWSKRNSTWHEKSEDDFNLKRTSLMMILNNIDKGNISMLSKMIGVVEKVFIIQWITWVHEMKEVVY